jgi:hypothetical protein
MLFVHVANFKKGPMESQTLEGTIMSRKELCLEATIGKNRQPNPMNKRYKKKRTPEIKYKNAVEYV